MTDQTPFKLKKAKADLVLDHPFFGSLALKLNYVPTKNVERMHVDGVNLFYNPDTIEECSEREMIGTIAQNVMHCALGHPLRRGERDKNRWDLACDHAVNLLLKDCKDMDLPEGSPCDLQYSDMTAEVIYNKIRDSDGEGDPGGDGGSGGGGSSYLSQGDSGLNDAPTNGQSKDDPSNGQAKSSDMSDTEMEQDWKVSTRQAAKAAKMQGNLPGHLEELLQKVLAPKVEWKDVLRDFMTARNKTDYSWIRCNRRHIAQGLYLPSAWSEALGDIVVAIDTSASVSTRELEQFQGELNAILEDCPPTKLHLIQCDTRINEVTEYGPYDLPINVKVKGRGGTDFEPVFDYVTQNNLDPECLIYLTDGWANSDFETPHYPTLWVIDDRNAPTPEFGQVTYLELSDE
jgi:predicted metal-dependent peptidase